MRTFLLIIVLLAVLFFLILDTFRGGERFIAGGFTTPINYKMATDICQKLNATLPRRTPEQTIASVNSIFMKLAAQSGGILRIWLDKCRASSTECATWAIDSQNSANSQYAWYMPSLSAGVHLGVCERGMSTNICHVVDN